MLELNKSQESTITNALGVAAHYFRDVATQLDTGTIGAEMDASTRAHLARQFMKKARESTDLANLIETHGLTAE